MKEEALKLADELDVLHQYVPSEAPNMIRKLVEELNKLNGCLIAEQEHNEMLQTKPLSDEEITFLWHKSIGLAISDENLKNNISHASIFARAIEERHGIK